MKFENPYACREKEKKSTMSYLEFDHIENWHEGFCLNDRGVMCQPSEDGRLHVVTRAIHDLRSKFRGRIQFCNRVSSVKVSQIHSISTKMLLSNPVYMHETQ